jgi:hypothetical protein
MGAKPIGDTGMTGEVVSGQREVRLAAGNVSHGVTIPKYVPVPPGVQGHTISGIGARFVPVPVCALPGDPCGVIPGGGVKQGAEVTSVRYRAKGYRAKIRVAGDCVGWKEMSSKPALASHAW